MKYFIANWKANKNEKEADSWAQSFLGLIEKDDVLQKSIEKTEIEIVVCPPFPFISTVKSLLKESSVKIGAQDISYFGGGAYTGEVSARMLTGVIDYVLVGHSERRQYFHEKDYTIDQKVANAKEAGIEPILCVRGNHDVIPGGVGIVAYEPVEAIGSGANQPVEKTLEMRSGLHIGRDTAFLYGGSVTEDNALEYVGQDKIDGLLVGGASLDPGRFYKIINSAL